MGPRQGLATRVGREGRPASPFSRGVPGYTTPMRRVVVTGLGALTPIGVGQEAFHKAQLAGKSGVRPITRFDASALPVRIAAEASGASRNALYDAALRWRKASQRTDQLLLALRLQKLERKLAFLVLQEGVQCLEQEIRMQK